MIRRKTVIIEIKIGMIEREIVTETEIRIEIAMIVTEIVTEIVIEIVIEITRDRTGDKKGRTIKTDATNPDTLSRRRQEREGIHKASRTETPNTERRMTEETKNDTHYQDNAFLQRILSLFRDLIS